MYRYHLKGAKKGTKEMFIEGLPGVPDNVRSNGKGGFYVSLVMPDTVEVIEKDQVNIAYTILSY